MARPDTWMPMYWRDFWADTGHLSPVEGWAYINLIGAYWTIGGPLENDDARLARQAKVSPKEWKAARPAVMAFFSVDDKLIHQKRIDAELAVAVARHAAKVKAGANGAEKRWQKHSRAIAEPSPSHKQTDAQLQPHSSNDETDATASGAKRLKPLKGTRLASDWKPSEETRNHGRKLNLTDDELGSVVTEFREYFTGPDATRPVKKDWDGACCRWITRAAPGVIARRPRSRQPQRHGSGSGSVFAALSQNLEAGDLGGQDDDARMGRGVDEDRMGEGFAGTGPSVGPENGATIIDADDWRRVPEGAGEAAVYDQGPQREHGGYPADVDVLRGRVA